MGDSDCGGCKKREENIYWSHFQTVQFFQILSGHYDLQLAIPQKFADNLREKLADSVSLKGPCGAIWNVDLEADGDKLYLKYGWKEFVEEHSLRENDVLVFKYNGNLQFDVTMFDGLTLCEKEASYFIRHCEHRELTIRAITNGTATPISYHDAAANESSHEEFETIPAEWARSHLPQKNINVSLHVNEKTWLAKCYYKTSSHGLAGSGWKNFALDNFLEKDDACVFSLVSQSDNSVIFNVRIFRVVEDVVAPNRVVGTPSRKSMQPT
nr:B3 domain-containing protein REM16-like [Ipomoea batatas]GMC69430.1 B3 domain-containing protein REM16-like [Ipomoea batatas]